MNAGKYGLFHVSLCWHAGWRYENTKLLLAVFIAFWCHLSCMPATRILYYCACVSAGNVRQELLQMNFKYPCISFINNAGLILLISWLIRDFCSRACIVNYQIKPISLPWHQFNLKSTQTRAVRLLYSLHPVI